MTTRLFGIDPRGLAAFRVGMGLLLLWDLAARAWSLGFHYTDDGVLPRALAVEAWPGDGRWSLHLLAGGGIGQAVLFLIAAAAAGALIVGYRTKLATVVSWVMLVSLQHRNPLVCNAADDLVAAMLFWAMFLPLGRCASLDARLSGGGEPPDRRPVLSAATTAILLQVVLMYVITGLFKWNELWHDGVALRRALHNDLYARPLGVWLREQVMLSSWLARGTPWFEVIAPLLAFVPVFTGRIRLVLILLFLGFHLGIELTLTTGLFPYASALGWVLFVPGAVWDRLFGRAMSTDEAEPGAAAWRWSAWRWAGEAVVAALLVAVLAWNVGELRRPRHLPRQPGLLRELAHAVGLDQRWVMFGRPGRRGGWYTILGTTEDGRRIDLLLDQPFDAELAGRPDRISAMFPTHRWRKHLNNLTHEGRQRYQATLGPALCAWWNGGHDDADRIDRIEVNFIEVTYPDDPASGEAAQMRRLVFYRGVCPRPDDIVLPPPTPEGI